MGPACRYFLDMVTAVQSDHLWCVCARSVCSAALTLLEHHVLHSGFDAKSIAIYLLDLPQEVCKLERILFVGAINALPRECRASCMRQVLAVVTAEERCRAPVREGSLRSLTAPTVLGAVVVSFLFPGICSGYWPGCRAKAR